MKPRTSSGVPVQVIRREEEHAVVSPAESAIELGDRHHLERRDPKRCQMLQPFTCRRSMCRRS